MADLTKTLLLLIKADDKASSELGALGSKAQALGGAITGVGAALTAGLTVPITAAAAAGTKMFIDLEAQMKNVQSISGQTNEEIAALTDSLIELSMDGTKTTDTASNLADALYEIQGAGFEVADAWTVMEVATKSGTAGLTTTAVAADALTTVLNAYALSAEEAEYMSDLMFVTVDRGKLTYEELASAMSNVVPTAAAMGVGFDEVGAAMATMTMQGFTASEASTNLNAALTAMIKPTEEMQAAIEAAGYSSGQAMIDALGFAGALDVLYQQAGGSTEQLAAMFGNVRGLRAIFSLTGANAGMFADNLDAMGDAAGRTAEVFATQSESFAFQWQHFMRVLEGGLMELGSVILPMLADLLSIITPILEEWIAGFRNMPEPLQQLMVVVLGLVAALGPFLVILGTIISWVGGIISALGTLGVTTASLTGIFSALGGVITAVGGVLAAISAPIWIIIGLVILLAAEIYILVTRWDEVVAGWQRSMGILGGLVDQLGTIFSLLGERIKGGIDQAALYVTNFGNVLMQRFEMIKQTAIAFVKAIPSLITAMLVNIMKTLVDKVGEWIKKFIDQIKDMANQVQSTLKSAFKISSPSKVMQGIADNLMSPFDSIPDRFVASFQPVTAISDGLTPSAVSGGGAGGVVVNIGTLNVPKGTTKEQADELMREIGKRLKNNL